MICLTDLDSGKMLTVVVRKEIIFTYSSEQFYLTHTVKTKLNHAD